MKFIRYLTCIVAAFAVIQYTVYLEVHTPVVYEVKTRLGLDTSHIEAARAGTATPGIIEIAGSFMDGTRSIPSLSEFMSASSASHQIAQLPEPLVGWMRQDGEIDLEDVADFEGSFVPGGSLLRADLHASIKDASGGDLESLAADHLEASGLKIAGAYYYRESMQLLVTISSLPKSMSWAIPQGKTKSDPSLSEGRSVMFNGTQLPVKRHNQSGYGQVQTMVGDRFMVQLRGDVPDEIFEAYLGAFDWDQLASL